MGILINKQRTGCIMGNTGQYFGSWIHHCLCCIVIYKVKYRISALLLMPHLHTSFTYSLGLFENPAGGKKCPMLQFKGKKQVKFIQILSDVRES